MSPQAKNIIVLSFATVLVTVVIMQTLYQPISTFEASTIKSIRSGVWSDPLVWDYKVPSFGDNVVISSGTVVTYDAYSTNAIGNLKIDGELIFSRFKSTNLDVGNIEVSPSGRLEIGTNDNPIPSRYSATIRFVMGISGQNGLIIRGQSEIHGAPIKHTFTKLASDVKQGSLNLSVMDDVQDWKQHSKIVITTTGRHSCTEVKSVLSALGKMGDEGKGTITLADPLRCYHSGTEPARADVALLTHNVVITSKNPNLRGHTMFMTNAKGNISYAEFVNLGPENQLAKYPIHFHMMGDTSEGMFVKGASIWNSTNRWITVHSSNGVTLEDNVGYSSVGHGYFLEGGDEVNNTIDHNIGILTKRGDLVSSDHASSVFWLENPYNRLTNNIAVRGNYYGYRYDVPNRIEEIKHLGGNVNLRSLAILQFDNNEAHSNGAYGLSTFVGAPYTAENQTIPLSTIKNFLSWRNGSWGLAIDGRGTNVTDSLFFGNTKGANIVFRADGNTVRNSQVIGELDDSKPAAVGILFNSGQNNLVINSTLERHNGSTLRTSADVRVGSGDFNINGNIIDTKMFSARTIIFGYPTYSSTHLTVQNYIAPNDNHSKVPKNFTLWRIDNQMNDVKADLYFVALVQETSP